MKRVIVALTVVTGTIAAPLTAQTDSLQRGIYLSFIPDSVSFDSLKNSLHLNSFQVYTSSNIDRLNYFLNNGFGLKVINWTGENTIAMSSAQQMVYQAEEQENSLRNYFKERPDSVSTQESDSRHSVAGVHSIGYMVKSARPDNEYRYNDDRNPYTATFRMKIDTTNNTGDSVAVCVVRCSNGQPLQERVLLMSEFQGSADYRDFVLHFTVPDRPPASLAMNPPMFSPTGGLPKHNEAAPCGGIDLQVYWYGYVTTYLDKVTVEDTLARILFSGGLDNIIRQEATLAAAYALHDKFYLWDEPFISSFRGWKYVGDQIKQAVGAINPKARRTTAMYDWFERFVIDADPSEVSPDPYFIFSDIPHPTITVAADAESAGIAPWNYSTYTERLQYWIDQYLDLNIRNSAVTAQQHSKPLVYIPQLHGIMYDENKKYRWPDNDGISLRPPSASEITLQWNIGLAYGAKGFLPYPYETVRGVWGEYGFTFPGLVSQQPKNGLYVDHDSNVATIYNKRIWTGYNEKWDAVAGLNGRLKIIGDSLLAFSWIGAKSWSNVPKDTLWSEIVTSVSTKDTLGNADGTPYVEVGHLKRGTAPDYIVVVNRRCAKRPDANDTRDISLTLDARQANWLATDIETNRAWVVKGGHAFTDRFQPGNGKIYRLEDATVNGTVVFPQLTFVGGAILTLAEGACVTAEGSMDTVRLLLGNTASFTADSGSSMVIARYNSFSPSATCSLRFSGTLTIADSVLLKFMEGTGALFGPGAQILLGPGAGLESNGTFSAQGSAASPVRFKSSSPTPTPGIWQMITLKGGPNTLRHSVVEYSQGGVYFNNTSTNLLDSCTVKYSSGFAVQAFNTSPNQNSVRLRDCKIDSNEAGLWLGSGRVDVVQTSSAFGIRNNPGYASVLHTGGKLYLDNTYITNNEWGVYVNGTTAQATFSPDGVARGYNRLRDSSFGQVWVQTGSALLGNTNTICRCDPIGSQENLQVEGKQPEGGGIEVNCSLPCYPVFLQYAGYNRISGPYPWVKNATGTTVPARLNYWGSPQQCPPTSPPLAFPGPGAVDYQFCQTGGGENFVGGKGDGGFEPQSENILDSALIRALIENLKDELVSGTVRARPSLHQLASLCGVGGEFSSPLPMDWRDLLDHVLARNVSVDIKNLVRAYRLQDMMDKKVFDQAITYANTISSIQDDELWFHAQSTIVYALVAKGQAEQADAHYQTIKGRAAGINPTATAHLDYFLGMQTGSQGSPGEGLAMAVSGDVATDRPSRTSLDGNYPNPFNPTTTIRFELPEPAAVSLVIYDLLGRKVAELANGNYEAGYHSATWNASDVASGVYLARFNVVNQLGNVVYTKTNKLVLMK